jgi:hypothetical protein
MTLRGVDFTLVVVIGLEVGDVTRRPQSWAQNNDERGSEHPRQRGKVVESTLRSAGGRRCRTGAGNAAVTAYRRSRLIRCSESFTRKPAPASTHSGTVA